MSRLRATQEVPFEPPKFSATRGSLGIEAKGPIRVYIVSIDWCFL